MEREKGPRGLEKSILVHLNMKKDRKNCDNYHAISLLSAPGKVFCLVVLNGLESIIDPQLQETQCGFRKSKGTIDQIWVTQQVLEKVNASSTISCSKPI